MPGTGCSSSSRVNSWLSSSVTQNRSLSVYKREGEGSMNEDSGSTSLRQRAADDWDPGPAQQTVFLTRVL